MGRRAKTTVTEPKGKRRMNGEGTVTVRSDGRVMGRYFFNGHRYTIYGPSEIEVRAQIAAITTEIRNQEHVAPERTTVDDWLPTWLERYCLPVLKPSTYTSYKGHTKNHLRPYLGKCTLQSLDIDTLQDHFNFLRLKGNTRNPGQPLKPKAVKNIYNTFRLALDQAVLSKKIKFNPIYGVKLAKIEEIEHRVFTIREQEAMCRAAFLADELHAFGIIFALATGLRIGELLGLRWEDFSERQHTFAVRRTVERVELPEAQQKATGKKTYISIDSPKTPKARRTVAIFDELWNDLMVYMQRQRLLKKEMGWVEDQGYVFCNAFGKVMEPKTYSDLWHRVRKSAGISYAAFHTTRHTFATRALENGMDVKVLSELLGHAQVSTTLNMYGTVLEEHKKTSMDKMNETYTSENMIKASITYVECEKDPDEVLEEVVQDEPADPTEKKCEVIYFMHHKTISGISQ